MSSQRFPGLQHVRPQLLAAFLLVVAQGCRHASPELARSKAAPAALATESKPTDPEVAAAQSLLAKAEKALESGERGVARRSARQAISRLLRLREAAERKDVIAALTRAAGVAWSMQDAKAANRAMKLVVSYAERRLPADDIGLQRMRMNLASTMSRLGDLEGALSVQTRAVEALSRTLPEERSDLQQALRALGMTKMALGDVRGALALLQRVFDIRSRTLSDEHRDLQWARLNLAYAKKELGDLKGALALEEKACAVFAKTLPEDDPELMSARVNLAATRLQLGDPKGASKVFENVYEAFRRTRSEDDSDLQAVMQNLAVARRTLGNLKGALVLEEALYEIRSRTLPDDSPALQATRRNLAITRKELGDLKGALVLEKKVDEILSRSLPSKHRDLQTARMNLAMTKHKLGDLQGALTLLQGVVTVLTEILPPGHPDVLAARQNLAATMSALGDFDGAVELERRVYRSLLRALPDDHPDLQKSRMNLAVTLRELGDLEGALGLLERAYEINTRALPDEHPDLQLIRQDLANTKFALGDLRGCLALDQKVYEVRSMELPDHHADLQAARQNLATTKKLLGDVEGALKLEQKVHDVRSRSLPDAHPELQEIRLNLAVTKRVRHDLRGALALEEKVHAVLARTMSDDHPDLQKVRLNLALTKSALGELKSARSLQEKACSVYSRTRPESHPDRISAYAELAATLGALGDRTRCRALLRRSFEGATTHLSALATTISPRALDEANLRAASMLSCLLSYRPPEVSPDMAAAEELLFVLRFRGLADRQARVNEAIRRTAPTDKALSARLIAVRRANANYLRAIEGTELVAPSRLLELRHELEQAQERLLRGARGIADVVQAISVPKLAELAARIPEGGAGLVTASYMKPMPGRPVGGMKPEGTPSVIGFVLARNGSVRSVELGSAERLTRLCAELVAGVAVSVGRGGRALTKRNARKQLAVELSRQLKPLLDCIPDRTRVLYLCPEGALASIPWGILPLAGALLHERYAVRYLETLAALSPRAPLDQPPSLLAFGGVEYGGEPNIVGETRDSPGRFTMRKGGNWRALPGTLREAQSIVAVFDEKWPGKKRLLATGTEASRTNFLHSAPSYRVLHLATHGYLAPVRDWKVVAAIALAGRQLTTRQQAIGFDRGLLSGIVFAGANFPVRRGKDAAVLTATQLSGLDLSNCELAVLSACDTNVGPRYFGEAVTGLNRALQLAGARHTITSLWKVDDEGAARFFEVFYTKLWKAKLSVPKAFDATRAQMIKEGWGPVVWAGFVLYTTGVEG